MSSTSNSSNGASSGNKRQPPSRASSGPKRKAPTRPSSSSDDSEQPIVRHSPKKMRLPSNWTQVGQGSQGEPEFDFLQSQSQ